MSSWRSCGKPASTKPAAPPSLRGCAASPGTTCGAGSTGSGRRCRSKTPPTATTERAQMHRWTRRRPGAAPAAAARPRTGPVRAPERRSMSCGNDEDQVLDLARGVAPVEAAERLSLHLRTCASCAARFARERSLTSSLRELAAATADAEPPAAMEQVLRRQFTAYRLDQGTAGQPPAPRRPVRIGSPLTTRWLAAAAMLTALIGGALGWRSAARVAPSNSTLVPPLAATRTFAEHALDAPPVWASHGVDRTAPDAGAGGTGRRRVTAARPIHRADFVAWPGAAALPAMESGELVRTELPASVLPLLGIAPRHPVTPATTVTADVVVGQDGLVRAVRLVEER